MTSSIPLALLALGSLASDSRLDVSVRTEGRAGMVRAFDSVRPIPTADLRVIPRGLGYTAWRGLRLSAGYSPELWMRATGFGAAPLILHQAHAGITAGYGRGPKLEAAFSGLAGDVDFMLAGQQLEQPFGLAGQGGVVRMAAGGMVTRIFHQPTDDFEYGVLAQVRGLGTPTVYMADEPPLQVLPRTEAYAGLAVGRFDHFRLGVAAHGAAPFLLAAVPRTPRMAPAYVGLQPELRWAHRWTRTFNTSVTTGALFARQRLGFIFEQNTLVALPALTLSINDERRMLRWARVTTSINGGVRPLYDPFLLGITERAFVQFANGVELGNQWRMAISAQYLTLVTSVIPTSSRGAEIDDHIVMLTGSLQHWLTRNVIIEGGTFGGVRVNTNRRTGPEIAPQVTLYLAITTSYGLGA
jgi:hypothetical protein